MLSYQSPLSSRTTIKGSTCHFEIIGMSCSYDICLSVFINVLIHHNTSQETLHGVRSKSCLDLGRHRSCPSMGMWQRTGEIRFEPLSCTIWQTSWKENKRWCAAPYSSTWQGRPSNKSWNVSAVLNYLLSPRLQSLLLSPNSVISWLHYCPYFNTADIDSVMPQFKTFAVIKLFCLVLDDALNFILRMTFLYVMCIEYLERIH